MYVCVCVCVCVCVRVLVHVRVGETKSPKTSLWGRPHL